MELKKRIVALDIGTKRIGIATCDALWMCANPLKTINNKIKVLIDNGHGYDTAGKKSPYLVSGVEPALAIYEYKWNREIANGVYNRLKNLGADVELLVPEENDISLSERVTRVNNKCTTYGKNNVMLVSIHANAMGNGQKWEAASGWEAYTSPGTTQSDTIATIFYQNAEKIFVGKKIRRDNTDGDPDKESDFYILVNTNCPAVLTENFFYDNVEDATFMLSAEGKELIIKMHVDSIIEYLNSKE